MCGHLKKVLLQEKLSLHQKLFNILILKEMKYKKKLHSKEDSKQKVPYQT